MSAIEADPLQAELEFQLVGIVLGLVRSRSQPSILAEVLTKLGSWVAWCTRHVLFVGTRRRDPATTRAKRAPRGIRSDCRSPRSAAAA
jgi:hypothetical protein